MNRTTAAIQDARRGSRRGRPIQDDEGMNWFEQRNVVATDEAADWIGLTDRVADAFFEAYGTRYDTSKLICIRPQPPAPQQTSVRDMHCNAAFGSSRIVRLSRGRQIQRLHIPKITFFWLHGQFACAAVHLYCANQEEEIYRIMF